MRKLVLIVLLMSALPALAHAQAPLRMNRFAETSMQSSGRSVPALVFAGLVAGGVGMFVGGYSGALITDDPNNYDDVDFLPGLIWGATLGESVMLPVGVHLANRRQGKVIPAILASTAIGLGGVALAIAAQDRTPVPGLILGLTPVAQLAASIAIERATAR